MEFQDRDEDDDLFDLNIANDENGGKRRKKSAALYDPMLLEELEDVYHDAHDHLVLSFTNNTVLLSGG
jgi:hypothetical protein